MKTLKLYFFILNLALSTLSATSPTQTNQFIKPVVNLNTIYIDNKEAFIGFEGTPGNYKTAKLYNVNTEQGVEENKAFVFELSKNKTSSFFSAHVGGFTEKGKTELVVLVKDPMTGAKAYVWEITEAGFKRIYKNPYTINPEQSLSQPIEAIKTQNTEGEDQITVSFGSPNRNITVLSFTKEGINQTKNIAQNFLQNQAGNIFLLYNEDENKTTVYNTGEPTQSREYREGNPISQAEEHKTKGIINQVFYTKDGNVFFLMNFNQIFLVKEGKTINLNPLYKHKQILSYTNNQAHLLDLNGAELIYEIKKEDEAAKLIQKEESPFQGIQNIKQTESLIEETINYISAHTKQKNYFSYKTQKKLTNEIKKDRIIYEKNDTTIFETNKTGKIPIFLDKEKEFIELVIEEQPENIELNLENMSFFWKPTTENKGYNILKYNIIYNKSKGIVKKSQPQGKVTLNKEIIKEEHTKTHILYVNVPPEIFTTEEKHTIQTGHTLVVSLKTSDLNEDQKLTVQYNPTQKGAKIQQSEFIWTPFKEQQGNHEIVFSVSDGYTETKIINQVFIDTLKQTKKSTEKHILTVNEEFVLDLSINKEVKYKQNQGPENSWVSNDGKLHWIPLATQLGHNEIVIERRGEKNTDNVVVSAFVNSPPLISYRPDKTEYIVFNEDFMFEFKSFDANEGQKVYWDLIDAPEKMVFNENQFLEWSGSRLDYNNYTLSVSDTMSNDVFHGTVYVNNIPRVTSLPKEFIQLGEKYNYEIIAEDKNKFSPFDSTISNSLSYNLIKGPSSLSIENNTLLWEPTEEEVGLHRLEVDISDGLTNTLHVINLNVNDAPIISSPDSIHILVGDTLNHIINASDKNKKTELTYSIRTTISEMYLNGNTGEITWIPTEKDIGEHVVEVAVSDGFATGTNMKQIKIFVSKNPTLISLPPTEAYVGLDYNYSIKAQDAEGNEVPNQDVFINLKNTTFSNLNLDTLSFQVSTIPSVKDIGDQTMTLVLSDKNNNSVNYTFNVLVLASSPCEPEKEEDQNNYIKEEKPTSPTKTTKIKRLYKILIGLIGAGLISLNN